MTDHPISQAWTKVVPQQTCSGALYVTTSAWRRAVALHQSTGRGNGVGSACKVQRRAEAEVQVRTLNPSTLVARGTPCWVHFQNGPTNAQGFVLNSAKW